jgi:P pilus assembly chaperone PapD
MRYKTIFLFLIAGIILNLITGSLNAQVAITPQAIFIDPLSQTGSMQVINTSDEMREFDIKLKFGYFDYDSLGDRFMQMTDTAREKDFSLIPYVKVFPEELVIPPHEQQVVRFLVRGIPENKDQYYWTRVIAGSVPVTPQVDSAEKAKLHASLIIRSEMNGLLIYPKGINSASVDFDILKTYTDSLHLYLFFDFKKTGSTPYWGSITIQFFNASNEMAYKTSWPLSLYFSGKQRIYAPKKKFKPGRYTAKIAVSNELEQVPEEYRSKEMPSPKSVDFEIKDDMSVFVQK